mmetsp:Transcript_100764/g.200171  ORF Transcript_100764/g.200171 Transcript_100764/m.200171 type:complete len:209 (+) Transcript_100764:56-682(+)
MMMAPLLSTASQSIRVPSAGPASNCPANSASRKCMVGSASQGMPQKMPGAGRADRDSLTTIFVRRGPELNTKDTELSLASTPGLSDPLRTQLFAPENLANFTWSLAERYQLSLKVAHGVAIVRLTSNLESEDAHTEPGSCVDVYGSRFDPSVGHRNSVPCCSKPWSTSRATVALWLQSSSTYGIRPQLDGTRPLPFHASAGILALTNS